MLVGYLTPDDSSYIGDAELNNDGVTELRDRLRLAATEFQVLLIGKDGGVKARYKEPPLLAEVFALVDGMPMRRREIRSQSGPCKD